MVVFLAARSLYLLVTRLVVAQPVDLSEFSRAVHWMAGMAI